MYVYKPKHLKKRFPREALNTLEENLVHVHIALQTNIGIPKKSNGRDVSSSIRNVQYNLAKAFTEI